MKVNYKLIGSRIKEFRTDSCLSQAQLAEHTGLSASYISCIETGKKQVSLSALLQIADILDVTVDMILSGNQFNNTSDYQTEIDILMEDCNSAEKRFFFELIHSAKKILRDNNWVLSDDIR